MKFFFPVQAAVTLSLGMAAMAGSHQADVVVYGDASGGVTAAVQAARMGKSTILVSQYGHLGGMTSSGLGLTDMVKNEGDIQSYIGGKAYGISYRAITPSADECENLLVPWALSATHIAFGSIRMEPVFMVLGQSAATAACMAIDDGVPIQKVTYDKLRERLVLDNQKLE